MAKAAGVYHALWHPDQIGCEEAKYIIPQLEVGLENLLASPDHYMQFNPENKWGDYGSLVQFIKTVLQACKENPTALIETST